MLEIKNDVPIISQRIASCVAPNVSSFHLSFMIASNGSVSCAYCGRTVGIVPTCSFAT